MKKLSYLLFSVITAVLFHSCSKDVTIPVENYKAKIIDYNIEVKEANTNYQVRDYVIEKSSLVQIIY